jgi:hypothetical protein
MQLMMYIGNDLIEAVSLDRKQLPIPGYLGKIKRHLKEKYHSILQESSESPEFLITSLSAENKSSSSQSSLN